MGKRMPFEDRLDIACAMREEGERKRKRRGGRAFRRRLNSERSGRWGGGRVSPFRAPQQGGKDQARWWLERHEESHCESVETCTSVHSYRCQFRGRSGTVYSCTWDGWASRADGADDVEQTQSHQD